MKMELHIMPQRVKLRDLAIFSRQFATMIDSGLSLLRALNILAEQSENPKLAEAIKGIRDDVEQRLEPFCVHEQVPEDLQQPLRLDGSSR